MTAKLCTTCRDAARAINPDPDLGPGGTQVASVGHTLRRTFLTAIAGAPALALLSSKADAVSPIDAAVIAKAGEVRRLMMAWDAAHTRWLHLQTAYEDAVERELGPKPPIDKKAIADLCVEVLVSFGALTKGVDAAVAAKRRELEAILAAEVEKWESASKAIAGRLDLNAADRGASQAGLAMDVAMGELAAMPVASFRGIAAKASIFKAPEPFCIENFSHQDVAAAVMRDLGCEVALEGGANV